MASDNTKEPLIDGVVVHTASSDDIPPLQSYGSLTRNRDMGKTCLHFESANVTVNAGRRGERKILKDVSFSLYSGEVCALLGPSGSGKTTLLNVLSGRQRWNGKDFLATGNITVNSRPITVDALKKSIAFVLQDDAIPALQTVEEALSFAANLQLENADPEECRGRVNELITFLGLEKCRETFVGNQLIKGISGGERKRTAVGMELISDPEIIFLDEPTSGLDSFAAANLISYLKKIAVQKNAVVCCTIHQPSSELFELFDRVNCLRDGETIFAGKLSDMTNRKISKVYDEGCLDSPGKGEALSPQSALASALTRTASRAKDMKMHQKPLFHMLDFFNLSIPSNYNPADWLLLKAQTITDDQAKPLVEYCKFAVSAEVQDLFREINHQPDTQKSDQESAGSADAAGSSEKAVADAGASVDPSVVAAAASAAAGGTGVGLIELRLDPNEPEEGEDSNTSKVQKKLEKSTSVVSYEKAQSFANIRVRERKLFFTQLSYLVHREWLSLTRNRKSLIIRLCIALGQSLIYGAIFWQQGIDQKQYEADHPNPALTTPDDFADLTRAMRNEYGALSAMMIAAMFGNAQPVLLQFPLERPIFLKEYNSNMYSSVAYFLSKAVLELPVAFIQQFIVFAIATPLIGFNAPFLTLVLSSWLLAICSASLALMLSCACSSTEQALQCSPLIFVPQIMFSGIFLSIDKLRWLQPFQYLCALKYTLSIAAYYEFATWDWLRVTAESYPLTYGRVRKIFFDGIGLKPDQVWLSFVWLMMGFLLFRCIGLYCLRKKARYLL